MARPSGPDPEKVIQATLQRIIDGGPLQPGFAAKAILADLAGHRIILTHQPPAAQPCPEHPGIRPPCPICRS